MNALRNLLLVLVVLLILSLCHPVQAQDNAIDEVVFWSRLNTTDVLLQQAMYNSADDRANAIHQINNLWAGIDTIRLVDGTTLAVDLGWLSVDPSSDVKELQRLDSRVQALLDYYTKRIGSDPNLIISRLRQILEDNRFKQQKEETSTESSGGSGGGLSWLFSPLISQLIIFTLVMLAIAALILYVWRNMQVQSAQIDLSEVEEEPVTSQGATERAEQLIAAQDFRTAIRYLYLASLLSLDERGIIRYDPALTNREHLQQLSNRPQLYQQMRAVVDIFDRVWYGFWPADQHLYQAFRQHIEQLRNR